jgi:hypothetical protein
LTQAIAVTLVASMILTLPGLTAWADSNPQPVTVTSNNKPGNNYMQQGDCSGPNASSNWCTANLLLKLADQFGGLMSSGSGAGVIQQAVLNEVAGATIGHSGVSVNANVRDSNVGLTDQIPNQQVPYQINWNEFAAKLTPETIQSALDELKDNH